MVPGKIHKPALREERGKRRRQNGTSTTIGNFLLTSHRQKQNCCQTKCKPPGGQQPLALRPVIITAPWSENNSRSPWSNKVAHRRPPVGRGRPHEIEPVAWPCNWPRPRFGAGQSGSSDCLAEEVELVTPTYSKGQVHCHPVAGEVYNALRTSRRLIVIEKQGGFLPAFGQTK